MEKHGVSAIVAVIILALITVVASSTVALVLQNLLPTERNAVGVRLDVRLNGTYLVLKHLGGPPLKPGDLEIRVNGELIAVDWSAIYDDNLFNFGDNVATLFGSTPGELYWISVVFLPTGAMLFDGTVLCVRELVLFVWRLTTRDDFASRLADENVDWDSTPGDLMLGAAISLPENWKQLRWGGGPTPTLQVGEWNSPYDNYYRCENLVANENLILKGVKISEIQIATNEFVELYNPTPEEINMENWYFAYFVSGDLENSPTFIKSFNEAPEAIIPAYGFYLIVVYSGVEVDNDWDLGYSLGQLSDTAGSVGIYFENVAQLTLSSAKGVCIDKLGWGSLTNDVFEGAPYSTPPPADNSLERKARQRSTAENLAAGGVDENEGNSFDTNYNENDFVVQITPNFQSSRNHREIPPTFSLGGWLESSVFDAGQRVRWDNVSWNALVPAGVGGENRAADLEPETLVDGSNQVGENLSAFYNAWRVDGKYENLSESPPTSVTDVHRENTTVLENGSIAGGTSPDNLDADDAQYFLVNSEVLTSASNYSVQAEPDPLVDDNQQIGTLTGGALSDAQTQNSVYENISEEDIGAPESYTYVQSAEKVAITGSITSPENQEDNDDYYAILSQAALTLDYVENARDTTESNYNSISEGNSWNWPADLVSVTVDAEEDSWLLINFHAGVDVNEAGDKPQFRLVVNGTVVAESYEQTCTNDEDKTTELTRLYQVTAGSYTVKAQWQVLDSNNNGTGTGRCWEKSLYVAVIPVNALTVIENRSTQGDSYTIGPTPVWTTLTDMSLSITIDQTSWLLVNFHASYDINETDDELEFRILLDDSTEIAHGYNKMGTASEDKSIGLVSAYQVDAGSHTVEVQWKGTDTAGAATGTAYCWRKSMNILAIPVGSLVVENARSTTTNEYNSTAESNSWVYPADLLTVTVTVEEDSWLLMNFHASFYANDAGDKPQFRLILDSTVVAVGYNQQGVANEKSTLWIVGAYQVSPGTYTVKAQWQVLDDGDGTGTGYCEEKSLSVLAFAHKRLDVRENISNIPIQNNYMLELEYSIDSSADVYKVYVWDYGIDDWDEVGILDQTSWTTWQYLLPSTKISGGQVRVKFLDNHPIFASELRLDFVRVRAWGAAAYHLRWEHRVSGIGAHDSYEVRIYGYSEGDEENIEIYVWNASTNSWEFVDNLPQDSPAWRTFTVTGDYLVNDNLSIKYESADNEDSTQTTIHIDYCGVRGISEQGVLSLYHDSENVSFTGTLQNISVEVNFYSENGAVYNFEIYDWQNSSWLLLNSGWVGSSEVTWENTLSTTPENYISSNDNIRVRLRTDIEENIYRLCEDELIYRVTYVTAGCVLRWEHRVTRMDLRYENYEVRILGYRSSGDENVGVYVWNASSWVYIDNLPTSPGQWVEFQISSTYFDGENLSIKFEDLVEGDAIQDNVCLDYCGVEGVKEYSTALAVQVRAGTDNNPYDGAENWTEWVTVENNSSLGWARRYFQYRVFENTDLRSVSPSFQEILIRYTLIEYFENGYLESSVHDAEGATEWSVVEWDESTPTGTSISVFTRSGDTPVPDVSWSSWELCTDGGAVPSPLARYIQYKTVLSTTDNTLTPTLYEIRIKYFKG